MCMPDTKHAYNALHACHVEWHTVGWPVLANEAHVRLRSTVSGAFQQCTERALPALVPALEFGILAE